TADRNRSHWSTSKTPSYTKSVSWQHYRLNILNIIISGILIYGLFSWPGLGFVGAGLGLTISRYIGVMTPTY
ncbi:hypothetical protein, partial [Escherichia coli]|uniref:hypothetical protein n=2 Tax=Escherichia coli TaxID=562 RepID=UPI0012FF6DFF